MTTGFYSPTPDAFPSRMAHYRIVRKLGQGGMSIVYEGVDERLKRPIAIKILHPFLAERREYRSRFLREAEAVARLTHPNIVQIFDVSSAESDQLYIVTELLDGETLKDFCAHTSLSELPELSSMIIWEIASALDHAHKRGIIHRDIKPENIMICSDGQIKLMDFGIASMGSDESLTQSGTLLGSLAHVAPEVIKGEKAGFASDLFSLSTVFYWLLSKQLPFNADSPHALLKAIVDTPAQRIQMLSPFVSDDLAEVLERGMQKDPEHRFSSAVAMIEAIEAALHKLGVAIDAKQFHQVLKDPAHKLEQFKISLNEAMQKKLLAYEQQKNDVDAMVLQCRLGAVPTVFASTTKPKKRSLTLIFIAASMVLSIGALIVLWPAAAPKDSAPPLLSSEIAPSMPELVVENRETPAPEHEPAPAIVHNKHAHEESETRKNVAPPKADANNKAPLFRTVEIVVWPFADVSLDGNLIARDTKSIVLKLEVGHHKLAFAHTYAATVEKVIKVTEGPTPIEMRIFLDKSKPAFLVVRANVDSDIAVDDNYRGTAKKSLTQPIVIPMPDKSHAQTKEVIISQDNYQPIVIETEFVAGQTKELDVKLQPLAKTKKVIDSDATPAVKKLY